MDPRLRLFRTGIALDHESIFHFPWVKLNASLVYVHVPTNLLSPWNPWNSSHC